MDTEGNSQYTFEMHDWQPCDEAFFANKSKSKKGPPDSFVEPPEEYASEERILESSALDIKYVADVPGPVPSRGSTGYVEPLSTHPRTMDEPPEWSVDVCITGGIMRYGPWADRQR
jgi:hypothetical protein